MVKITVNLRLEQVNIAVIRKAISWLLLQDNDSWEEAASVEHSFHQKNRKGLR